MQSVQIFNLQVLAQFQWCTSPCCFHKHLTHAKEDWDTFESRFFGTLQGYNGKERKIETFVPLVFATRIYH